MRTALFVNFSNEPFTGAWDGKTKTFQSGQSVYMPEYLARHFAKHLTNRELLKLGFERDTSPKVKVLADGTEVIENERFMKLFNQACIPDSDEELTNSKDSLDVQIEVANKNRQERVSEKPAKPVAEKQSPNEPQVVLSPDFDNDGDDDSFGGKPDENLVVTV